MARGRMLDRRFMESKKVNSVPRDARLIYASILPFVDREGRTIAESLYLKAIVFRHSDFTQDEITLAIHQLARAGLLRLYANEDNAAIIEYVNFTKFNSPNVKEARSELPGPDDDGVFSVPEPQPNDAPALHVQSTGIASGERNVNGTSTLTKTEELTPSSTSLTRESVQPFMDAWNENRGHLPAVTTINTTRRAKIKALTKEHGPQALDLFTDATRAVALDEYWVQKQYGIDNLLRPGRVVEKAEKYRAGAVQLGDANMRMATQINRWAKALDAVDDRPVN